VFARISGFPLSNSWDFKMKPLPSVFFFPPKGSWMSRSEESLCSFNCVNQFQTQFVGAISYPYIIDTLLSIAFFPISWSFKPSLKRLKHYHLLHTFSNLGINIICMPALQFSFQLDWLVLHIFKFCSFK
jgi:hypothetical protein